VLAENAHPFENPSLRDGDLFGLLGLSGCSLSGWHFSARTVTDCESATVTGIMRGKQLFRNLIIGTTLRARTAKTCHYASREQRSQPCAAFAEQVDASGFYTLAPRVP
jgi:hypothetical protein